MQRCPSRSPLSLPALRSLLGGLLALVLCAPLTVLSVRPAQGDHTSVPSRVTLMGSLMSELGCPADWDEACVATDLLATGAPGVFALTAHVPAGSYEYKVRLDGSWTENYGAGAALNGANIPLVLDADATVTFLYDHGTHWVTDSRTSAVATAVGTFQDELGCTADWDPACLRTWLQDPDGDGTYTYSTRAIPAGTYGWKIARDLSLGTTFPAEDVTFIVPLAGDRVTFTYTPANADAVDVDVEHVDTGVEPGDADLVANSLRNDLSGEKFYFLMPDRFATGDPSNNTGGIPGGPLDHGYDPTNKGFYNGGDLAGVVEQLDYIEGLGTTAIWMTPMFENKPVQGSGDAASAAYHGYWTTDYTRIDPHFGTNAEMAAVIDAAHARGIKVFFDIVTNHTADVIDYAEGKYDYRGKAAWPFVDAEGNEFDDRAHVGTGELPPMDPGSFPYVPVLAPGEEDAKTPDWLNDLTNYHNRGDSTFVGENSLYGDFFGLDDLFTEKKEVVDGMIAIAKTWIDDLGIDGYRIDTVKHVNTEFWQRFGPAVVDYARAQGNEDFFLFGEVFDGNPSFTSHYTTDGRLQAILDFPFQGRARGFASGAATNELRDLFAQDDLYLDADSNAYSLPTFLGNHDVGRIGTFLRRDNPTAGDAELLARDRLAHELMYFSRGNPVVYYGDEQGFSASADDGVADKDTREDMFASQVASYNDNDLIGTDATTAQDNYVPTHPLYQALSGLAAVTAEHEALRSGAQIPRYSTTGSGVFAFSRMDGDDQVEYVVALNNATTEKTVTIPTFSADGSFSGVYPAGLPAASTDRDESLVLTVPALSSVVYRADAPLAEDVISPEIAIDPPAAGSEVLGKVAINAAVEDDGFTQVTFAVRPEGAEDWQVIGTDDNAPYSIQYDTSGLTAGSTLDIKAIAADSSGNLGADRVAVVVGAEEPERPPGTAAPRDHLIVHYQRPAVDYEGTGLYLFGDVDASELTEFPATRPFQGSDTYGEWTWVKLAPDAANVGFIVLKDGVKDVDADRFANPSVTPEIWLKQGDPTIYTSRAAAQGHVTIHYQRPAGDYDNSGVYLFGEGVDESELTTFPETRPFTGTDAYGVFANVKIKPTGGTVGFIVLKDGVKDTDPDRFIDPATTSDVWIKQGDTAIYSSAAAAGGVAVIHYNRPDGNYAGWTLYHWTGSAVPTPDYNNSPPPTGTDHFGVYWEVALAPGATLLNFIIHNNSTGTDIKDPGADSALDLATYGNEVWFLSGDAASDGSTEFILPVVGGGGPDADLALAKAHWIRKDVVAWDIEPSGTHAYTLRYSEAGDIEVTAAGPTGGKVLHMEVIEEGMPPELAAKWPHLADYTALRVRSLDLDRLPDALRGQVVAVDRDGTGTPRIATSVQLPGVIDDYYAGAASEQAFGPVVTRDGVTLRVWAPTAQSVSLLVYDNPSDTSATTMEMERDDASGAWSTSGPRSWIGLYYRYAVKVWAPSVQEIVTNEVTDPYSLAVATNSTHSQIIDLDARWLEPRGWDDLEKPELEEPEDQSIYELHVRDFSISDESVPEEERGTYLAFRNENSDGMEHLEDLADAGLTTVHLLPAFDIATIEERRAAQAEPDCDLRSYAPDSEEQQACIEPVRDTDGFNWGYDPLHYTTPEGSYSTRPLGALRTREFRRMVKELNETGLRVVMDVVYNHTAAAGQDPKSVLDRVVPGYYHRLDENGAVTTSTCCSNTATEHAMMGKLMVDSIVTWARDYKVDGFRFDLMGHHTKQNMLDVRAALDALTMEEDGVDGKSIYLYGEGWNFGEVANDARFEQATQLNMAGTGIGTFNDRLRDAVRGGGPFDGDPRAQGFGSGLWTDPNGAEINGTPEAQLAELQLSMDQIKVGLSGNLKDYSFIDRTGATVKGSEVDYGGSPVGYTDDPQESITYVDAHDNETLFDALAFKLPQSTSAADRGRMSTLSLATTALGQGVSFWHAGAEIERSKSLDRNSYNSGDWFNRIDWTYRDNGFGSGLPPATDNQDKWGFMRPLLADPDLAPGRAEIRAAKARAEELLEIRASSELFSLGSFAAVQDQLSFPVTSSASPGVIVMQLDDDGAVDVDRRLEHVVVVYNATPNATTQSVSGMAGVDFTLHRTQRRGSDTVVKGSSHDSATGSFTVPGRTAAVFVAG